MEDSTNAEVTLLFTDIEGSTRLLQRLGDDYPAALEQHHQILEMAVRTCNGRIVDTEGDAIFAAFEQPTQATDAISAALAAQRSLASHPWPAGESIWVRMGVHTGHPARRGERYIGLDVHRAARIAASAHGGQVVLSADSAARLSDRPPLGTTLRDLGRHRLKDLDQPERIYQLVAPDLRTEFAPLKTLEARPSNLPPELTSIIGRDLEIEALYKLLQDQSVRLVTVTGPAGTGKTRVAIHAARQLLTEHPDGVTFVALASLGTADEVGPALAQTLGVRSFPRVPIVETLKTALRDKQALLVLDNFEHVLGAAALIAQLIAACPRLKLLVTSRVVLRLTAETEYRLGGLAVPDPRRPTRLEQLARYDAVRLFIERSKAVRADFVLTPDNAAAIAAICTQLDGLPLAIELAAARARTLDAATLQRRLHSRLSLLARGPADLPERQQTLRTAIAWSFDLLNPEEQALFRRLSVFADPFTVEAAESVCNLARGQPDLLDLTESLVDSSLLQSVGSTPVRLRMLETIKEFAVETLFESGEAGQLREAHMRYFAAVAQEHTPKLRSHAMRETVRAIMDVQQDLRVALDWARAHHPEASATLEEALRSFGLQRAYLSVW